MGWLLRRLARRFVIAIVVAATSIALNMCTSGAAHAANYGDQGEAYAGCLKTAAAAGPIARPNNGTTGATGVGKCDYRAAAATGKDAYFCQFQTKIAGGSTAYLNCAEATGYDNYHYFPTDQTCSVRNTSFPPGDKAARSPMPWPNCVSGCKLQQESLSYAQPGGVTLYGRRNATYLNEVCTPDATSSDGTIDTKAEQPKPTQPECTALGNGQTACSKSNGDYCATASTGKTFCWQPAEAGKKVDGQDAQVKDKAGLPVTPPDTLIEGKDWQRKEGHQVTACVNNTCTTYNVTNFATVGAGTAKNGTGDNKGDGSGNTSGNGGVSAGGKDDDSEDSATDSGNCDTPPICVGDTLKCLQLKYTWKIECNTKGNEISQGNGCGENDIPVCAGKSCKAESYAQVIQQWKQRCAMEALGQGNAERAAGISNGDDAGVVEGIWGGEPGGTGMTLRQDLVNVGGGGGSLLPDVEIEGQHWNVPQGFYDAIAAVRMVIIAMCTVIAMFVVGRNI